WSCPKKRKPNFLRTERKRGESLQKSCLVTQEREKGRTGKKMSLPREHGRSGGKSSGGDRKSRNRSDSLVPTGGIRAPFPATPLCRFRGRRCRTGIHERFRSRSGGR